MAEWNNDYELLRRSLRLEEGGAAPVSSPLFLLLERIKSRAVQLLGVAPDDFLDWLEATAPATVSAQAGSGAINERARLADAMDELDAVILTALEELSRFDDADMTRARAEELLANMWRKTFTAVAAAEEAWLERAFIRRGAGIVDHLYPDSEERRRLYQYGLPPVIGRRFEPVAEQMRQTLADTEGYGALDAEARIQTIYILGQLIEGDRGFGFRVRATAGDQALLAGWFNVLWWWLQGPNAEGPSAEDLRSWQRFVADNLEFRLGVTIGAVVAQAWSEGAPDAFTTPSLADWKATTGLPWFAFWARELLRWGTHDPFVAFCLAQGLAKTREAAAARREDYEDWMAGSVDDPSKEDLIDPQLFLRWQASLRPADRAVPAESQLRAALTGTDGGRGRYPVIPILRDDNVAWLDPAGFELATSERDRRILKRTSRSDYELVTDGAVPTIKRVFRPA